MREISLILENVKKEQKYFQDSVKSTFNFFRPWLKHL